MKILILGDVVATADSAPLFASRQIGELFSDDVRELFRRNDECSVNVECAISDKELKPLHKIGPNLLCPSGTADTRAELGVTLAGLSNNHTFDYGKDGLYETVSELARVGIAVTGFGENYEKSRKNHIYDNGKERVAVINVCEHEYSYALADRLGARPFDIYDTVKDIKDAKAECSRVIVLFHGGKENCRYPSDRLVKVFRLMAESGADVVVGQHSHCIGAYECFNGSHLLYGQGNFHFAGLGDSGFATGEAWNSCLALEYDTESGEVNFTPLCADGLKLSVANGERGQRIMAQFKDRCAHPELWRRGWLEFVESVRDVYSGVMKRSMADDANEKERQFFAHYLDCEAHLDVLFEVFKTWNHENELD